MRQLSKYLALVICTILIATSFSATGSYSSESTSTGTEIVLVSLYGEDDLGRIESVGGEILKRYPNTALVNLPKDEIDSTGIQVRSTLLERTKISVGEHRFDITESKFDLPEETTIEGYEEGEKGQYIVHMLGPIALEWRAEIEDKGIDVMNYLHNYAYRVRMTREQAKDVEDLDFVDWVGLYHPEYKIQPGLELGTVNIMLIPGAGRETVKKIAETVPIMSSIELQDGGFKIRAEVDSEETLHELASVTDVSYISEKVEVELHDEMATQIIGGGTWFYPDGWEPGDNAYRDLDLPGKYAGLAGSYLNQVGYTGDGIVVAIADTGLGDGTTPDAGHDDFTGRVIGGHNFDGGGWDDEHGHGTHCAGSVAADTYHGTGQGYGFDEYYAAQGSAPEAELYSQKIFKGGSIPDDLYLLFEEAKQSAGAYVHSNSWGSTGGHGTYTEQSAVFDAAVRDANLDTDHNEPMIITGSAGNDGDEGVPPPATAKNMITVGATENYNSETDDPEYMASFSSRGFVDDNRVKPDIVAPGADIYSTEPGNSYQSMSGTSMANPAVAGVSAVAVEWYRRNDKDNERPSPAMVKALLINTANPLDGDTEGPIPNGDEGWGMVDVSKLQEPHDDPVSFMLEDQESPLATGEFNKHKVGIEDATKPLKITLHWTDKEAPDGTGSDTALVNDLNLKVESPGGDVYQGNAFAEDAGGQSTWDFTYPNTDTMSVFDDDGDGLDDTNNVQNVYIHPDHLESGAYTITVEGLNVPEDGNRDGETTQDYALAVYNAAEGPQIEFERPEVGEYWEVGTDEDILWNTKEGVGNITDIDLEYSVDGGTSWGYIVKGHDDTGVCTWTVPDEPTEEAMVRATVHDDLGDTGPGNDTSGRFTITNVTPLEVNLTSPVGGVEWHAGDLKDVTWDSAEGDNPITGVDLEYSTDGGDSWNMIVEGTDDAGNYTWEIPDETTSEAIVRVWVRSQENTSDFDTSEHFDLVGYPPETPKNLDVEWLDETVLFKDDISEDKGYETWESHDNASEWGIRQQGSFVGNNSWDWGNGSFNKGPEMESRLISPKIEIPADTVTAELKFEHWRNFGDNDLWDGGNLKISEDGGEFEIIEPKEGYDGTIQIGYDNPLGGEPGWGLMREKWETATFNLSDFVGSTIQLSWNAGVENYDGYYGEGWRIDDIMVTAQTTTTNLKDDPVHNFVTWDSAPGDSSGEIISEEVKEIDHYSIYRAEEWDDPWDEPIAEIEADGSVSYEFIDQGVAGEPYHWYVVRSVSKEGLEEENQMAVPEPGVEQGPLPPSDPDPSDRVTGVGTDVELSVHVEHRSGKSMNVSFYNASDNSSIGTDMNVQNGERAQIQWTGLSPGTVYGWYAIAEDGERKAASEIWNFTTVNQYDLTISVDGQGTTEPLAGTHSYIESSEVNLEATPDQDWEFVEWTGDHSGMEKNITITMESDKNITAHFEEQVSETYNLTVNVDGQGMVTVDPDQEGYKKGTEVSLTASPDEEWNFVEWTGDFNGTSISVNITMDEDKQITAWFEEEITVEYNLTIDIEGEGNTDPPKGSHTYAEGTDVPVEAKPTKDWEFVEWTGDHSGMEKNITITMESDKNITAHFKEQVSETYNLTINVDGQGDVTVEPAQDEYEVGTAVNLTAVPSQDWRFIEWTGDHEGTSEEITVTVDRDKEFTAHFEELDKYDLKIEVDGEGDTNPVEGNHTYYQGEVVTVEAKPTKGWEFVEWTGDVTGSRPIMNVTMEFNKSITAVFQEEVLEYDLTINISGQGNTKPEKGIHTYEDGETVRVEATPAEAWVFVEWTGSETSDDLTIEIMMDENKSITAVFEKVVEYDLNINIEGEGSTDPEEGTQSYEEGTIVSVEVIPNEGWYFDGWTGDYTGSGEEKGILITIDENKTITAVFEDYATLMLNNITGQGTVKVDGSEVSETPFERYYERGETADLIADAPESWEFSRWAGDYEGIEKEITITINGDKKITAHFEELEEKFEVLDFEVGPGEGYVPLEVHITGGVENTGDAEGTIKLETDGRELNNWTLLPGDITTVDETYTYEDEGQYFVSLGSECIEVNVDDVETYTLEVNIEGEGEVDIAPDREEYEDGTLVTLTALANEGWRFEEWKGDETSADLTMDITVDDHKEITAVFGEDIETYELTIQIEGEGDIEVDPEQVAYEENTEVKLEALPEENWYFVEWTGDYEGEDEKEMIMITMDKDKEITANFEKYDPPYFDVEILEYDEDVKEDEEITVGFRVKNTGEFEGEQKLVLKVDEKKVETKELALDGGQKREGEFTIEGKEVGEHELELYSADDASDEVMVMVEEDVDPDDGEEDPVSTYWWLIIVLLVGILVTIILVLAMKGEDDETEEIACYE